jgi:hypothetical protein
MPAPMRCSYRPDLLASLEATCFDEDRILALGRIDRDADRDQSSICHFTNATSPSRVTA